MLRTLNGEARKHGMGPISQFEPHQTSVNILYCQFPRYPLFSIHCDMLIREAFLLSLSGFQISVGYQRSSHVKPKIELGK